MIDRKYCPALRNDSYDPLSNMTDPYENFTVFDCTPDFERGIGPVKNLYGFILTLLGCVGTIGNMLIIYSVFTQKV